MATEILMPKLGLTMKTGTIVGWLKNEGESVGAKEPLLEIETEKLSYNIESPAKGVLLSKLVNVGEKYPIATVLGFVGGKGEQAPDVAKPVPMVSDADDNISVASVAAAAAPVTSASITAAVASPAVPNVATSNAANSASLRAPAGRIFISPAAKKIAAAMGIDYSQIRGTGPNGRIVKADVMEFNGNSGNGIAQADTAVAAYGTPGTLIPYTGIRRAIGETMFKAWNTIPMVTHHVSADAGGITDYRTMLNSGVIDKKDQVTIGELMLKLTASALLIMPIVNSSLTPGGIHIHDTVNLGVATALNEGLIVPVIHNAGAKNLLILSREAKYLAMRARSGGLTPDEVAGGTFTVSNLGSYGSVDYFSPIINPPQAAILGIGRVVNSAVPIDGEVKIRPTVGLSFTYDHRIIDGATAALFIKTLMQLMDNPARALLM